MDLDHVGGDTASYHRLLARLSEASVVHRSEAYRDIDWDARELAIDPSDPRWIATESWDPLAGSEWYRDQPVDLQASIGLHRQACVLKIAIEFERVLSEGLLRFAWSLPNGDPTFRYIHHEITEEAQHTMMFQEFIDRTGLDVPGADERVKGLFQRVARFGDELPILFFLAILSGEEAFDFVQRRMLASPTVHPLIARISRIHIAEEARHLSFGRAYLRDAVPRLTNREQRHLRYQVAFVVEWTASRMFDLSASLPAGCDVPDDVRESVNAGSAAQTLRQESVARMVGLCDELDLVDTRLDKVWSQLRRRRTSEQTTR